MLWLMLLLPVAANAQNKLEFYYIAHNQYEVALTALLDDIRLDARYDNNRRVIFYLSNRKDPVYLVVSPNDEKEYEIFRDALNSQSSHTVYPEVDRMKIMELFSTGNAIPTIGFSSYDRVVFNFYVNRGFVEMEYGDSLIGRLYWDMDLASLPRKDVNVYYPSSEEVNEDKVFGQKNLFGDYEPLINTF